MKLLRIFSAGLVIVVLLGALSGCSQPKEETKAGQEEQSQANSPDMQ